MPPMNRRDALKATTAMLGGALIASSGVLAACARTEPKRTASSGVVTRDDQDLLEQIADTIYPTTASSPGAKAAGVGPVMTLLLNDCYEPPDQQRAIRGLADFRAACSSVNGAAFGALPRAKREQFLRDVDAEAKKAGDKHYFHLVRDLTNTAYFSSEVGMTKALRYERIPGKWIGCMPLKPGQPAWG